MSLISKTEERTILIGGRIAESDVCRWFSTVHLMTLTELDPITLLINSDKGDVGIALRFSVWLRANSGIHPAPLIGRVIDKADTASLIILSSCQIRQAHAKAKFNLKLGTVKEFELCSDGSIVRIIGTSKQGGQIASHIAEGIGSNKTAVAKLAANDNFGTYLAQREGIINEVI